MVYSGSLQGLGIGILNVVAELLEDIFRSPEASGEDDVILFCISVGRRQTENNFSYDGVCSASTFVFHYHLV